VAALEVAQLAGRAPATVGGDGLVEQEAGDLRVAVAEVEAGRELAGEGSCETKPAARAPAIACS
jgi:hypothetical protein